MKSNQEENIGRWRDDRRAPNQSTSSPKKPARKSLARWAWLTLLGTVGAITGPALAQHHHNPKWNSTARQHTERWNGVSHVILPQSRAFALRERKSGVQITSIDVHVSIRNRTARTTLDIHLANSGPRQAESVLLLPVPEGAVVGGFQFDGPALEPTAKLLPSGEARATYDDIVRRLKDPALLEFAGYNLIRSSVFPVPARGKQHLRVSYDHVLDVDGERVDYFLPRSEALTNRVPWNIEVRIQEAHPITLVYSPSHQLEQNRLDAAGASLQLRSRTSLDPGALHISYLLQGAGMGASFLAYPDPTVGGGYFLMMAGLPTDKGGKAMHQPREVTLVVDRSGSMAGEKLDQTLAAVRQVIESLESNESFNIIDYSSQVEMFAPAPVQKTRENILAARRYLAAIRPTGGTNIHDALLRSLRQPVTSGRIPIVLFLTDGLPTVGRTNEIEIREMVQAVNKGGRRVFTFGVGKDVNVPLLDAISDGTRAVGTYVLPGEDVETKVAGVFKRLAGPVLSNLELQVFDSSGALTTRALRDMFPRNLPDLFEGDPLVLLGQYLGAQKLRFRLSGNSYGRKRTFEFGFDTSHASVRNAFVPRLWAGRKIAYLVDAIRQAGARDRLQDMTSVNVFEDPRFRELAEEILRLSTRFGILSEYTSFLATEGTKLSDWEWLAQSCRAQLDHRAVKERSGESAVNQGRNFNNRKTQSVVDYSSGYWNEKSERVSFHAVQQVADRSFYQQNGQWVDSRVITNGAGLTPTETHSLGSPEHLRILNVLVREGRQGMLSFQGDILLHFEGKNVLIRNGAEAGGSPR